jgi:hypothetical protein
LKSVVRLSQSGSVVKQKDYELRQNSGGQKQSANVWRPSACVLRKSNRRRERFAKRPRMHAVPRRRMRKLNSDVQRQHEVQGNLVLAGGNNLLAGGSLLQAGVMDQISLRVEEVLLRGRITEVHRHMQQSILKYTQMWIMHGGNLNRHSGWPRHIAWLQKRQSGKEFKQLSVMPRQLLREHELPILAMHGIAY